MYPLAVTFWGKIGQARPCGSDASLGPNVWQRLERVHQLFGVPPWLLILFGVFMFGAWTAAYAAIIVRCFKDKTYGVPVMIGSLDICWEAIFTFNFAGMLSIPLNLGNAFWLIPDSLILLQVYLYGKNAQTNPWIRKNFHLICTLTLIASAVGLYGFMTYSNDVFGAESSWIIDIILSVMMLDMFFHRPDLKGIPYSMTWFKLIGNVASGLFCYYWWRAQFHFKVPLGQPGELTVCWANNHPLTIPEPQSYWFMNFLYVTVPILDALLVYLVWKRRNELRQAKVAAVTGAGAIDATAR